MKQLIAALVFSSLSFSVMGSTVVCTSKVMLQEGGYLYKTDAKLSFELRKDGNNSDITNLKGHVFVKSDPDDKTPFTADDDSYRGEFKISKLNANPNYKPLKYKGFAQFQNVDATNNDMWGELVVNVSGKNKLTANYIFKAGDHIGGTAVFSCTEK